VLARAEGIGIALGSRGTEKGQLHGYLAFQ
jgi:hypothetical protein